MRSVNAFSFALPYNPQDMSYEGVKIIDLEQMENLTNDRLHSNGTKTLYPTFVNIGNKKSLEGSKDLFVIKMKANKDLKINV